MPSRPRGSERISIATGAILLAYVLLFASGLAADGGGWFLALLGYGFVIYVAPLMSLIAVITAVVTRKRRTGGDLSKALILVAAVLAFDIMLLTSRQFQPRGPLG